MCFSLLLQDNIQACLDDSTCVSKHAATCMYIDLYFQIMLCVTELCSATLTLSLLKPNILAPLRNVSTANADISCNLFGNADRLLSFYLTAQCRNTEHVSKQSWL
jgi:hypothetical protein